MPLTVQPHVLPAPSAQQAVHPLGPAILPALERRGAVAVPPDAESAALLPLVNRTCQALQAMATSLEALEHFGSRMAVMEPKAEQHADLMGGARQTLADVVSLLRREGPPLLFRAQALRLRLRLHGYEADANAALAMRALHADLDGLVVLMPDRTGRPASDWGALIRQALANTRTMLGEFERHAEHIAVELYVGGGMQLGAEAG